MIFKGIFWDFLGKFMSQGLGFVASIFLARILMPEDFGLVAIAIVFINFPQILVNMGFGKALIQQQEVSDKLYATVFWVNVIMGITLSISMFFAAPYIAAFYDNIALTPILRVFSFLYLFNGLSIVQDAQLKKNMNFRTLSFVSVLATIVSSFTAVFLAYYGWGYKALVAQQLIMHAVRLIGLWSFNSWCPGFYFRLQEIKKIWGFSSRMFLSGIIGNIMNALDTLIIGKIYPVQALGFYNRSKNLNEIVRSYSASGVATVLFSAVSSIQDEKQRVTKLFMDYLQYIAILSVALTGLLLLVGEELILLLYTEKWAESIPIFQLFIWSSFVIPINALSLNTLNGMGFIKRTFNLDLIKKGYLFISFGIAYFLSIYFFAFFIALQFILSFALNTHAIHQLLSISAKNQINTLLKNLLLGVIAFGVAFFIHYYINWSSLLLDLLMKAVLFGVIYLYLQFLFNKTAFKDLINKVFKRLQSNRSA